MVDVADDADRSQLIRVFLQCAELLCRGEALALGWWGRLSHSARMQWCWPIAATTSRRVAQSECVRKGYIARFAARRNNQALLAACKTLALLFRLLPTDGVCVVVAFCFHVGYY